MKISIEIENEELRAAICKWAENQKAPAQAAVADPTVPVETVVPVQEVKYTREDLSRAGVELVDDGKQELLIGLLKEFGVQSLVELPEVHFGEFASKIRDLGAKI